MKQRGERNKKSTKSDRQVGRWERDMETAQRICDSKQHELNNNDIHRNLTSFDIHFMSFQPNQTKPNQNSKASMCLCARMWLQKTFARSLAQMCGALTHTRSQLWWSEQRQKRKKRMWSIFFSFANSMRQYIEHKSTHTHLNGNQTGKTYAATAAEATVTTAIYFGRLSARLCVCACGLNRVDVKKYYKTTECQNQTSDPNNVIG